MKSGAENRKKTIMAGVLVALALCCLFYAYNALYGGSTTPPSTVAPITPVTPPARTTRAAAAPTTAGARTAAASAPGVSATLIATTSASLDPTLDESAMHRTESLVYSGTGRNIFSATYTPPAPRLPTHVPPPRPRPGPVTPPAPIGPPPPPPINLKFFGTAKRANTGLQAFLLSGEDVYMASVGEVVAHKYKIVGISPNSIQVLDLQYNNTQTLPLQMQ